jgi:PIN domain nuclease of toxin-antitoxin system
MKLLLDTHALAWWWIEDKRLPQVARTAIANPDNTVLVSAATAWELATKHRLGKWPDVAAIVDDLDALLRRSRSHWRMRVWPARSTGRTAIRSIGC